MALATGRSTTIDAARGLAAILMVVGHTADACLDTAGRASRFVQAYFQFRGFTAPLFFVVAGWAGALYVERQRVFGSPILRSKMRRLALLLLLGYVLRLPAWDWDGFLAGGLATWSHFLAFDALHCIATSLFFILALGALLTSRRARTIAFAMGALVIPALTGEAYAIIEHEGVPLWFRMSIGSPGSPFPILPWVAYGSAGALGATLLPHTFGRRARARWLFASGLGLVLAARLATSGPYVVANPAVFCERLGATSLLLSALHLLPLPWIEKLISFGRAALGIYVFHLVEVYGWGSFSGLAGVVGPTLPPLGVLALAALLLLSCFAILRAWAASAPAIRAFCKAPGDKLRRVLHRLRMARGVL
jgi:uncharacterized membrane protein